MKNEKPWQYILKDSRYPIKHYVENFLVYEDNKRRSEVIDSSVGYQSAVAAVKTTDKETGKERVQAVVVEFRRLPAKERQKHLEEGNDYTFAWRAFDESEGPAIAKAPRHLLESLSPADNPLAKKWREECWRRVRELEDKGYRPIVVGDIIKLREPVLFDDNVERSVFLVTHDGKGRIGVGGVSLEDTTPVSLNRLMGRGSMGVERINLPDRVPKNVMAPLVLHSFPQENGEVSFVAISSVREKNTHPSSRIVARSFYRDEIENDVHRVNEDYKQQKFYLENDGPTM